MPDPRNGPALPPVGALLRRPAVFVRHEVIARLHEAGFEDILPAHLGVFQHPGPDGQKPGVLARRARASKQAMNHLLHQLEAGGYLTRGNPAPDSTDHRTHVVRLTERGWEADALIRRTMSRLDEQWRADLGEDAYRSLARGLQGLHEIFEAQSSSR
jgi:DNA-binding MarR family transcriptional regulator